MSLFKNATPGAAYLKAGFYGGTGSGKTYTASLLAIGLHKYLKAKKPVFFGDSETGSDYVQHLFEEAEVPLKVAKSRSFVDLLSMFEDAVNDASIFLYDSISHPWDELVEGYKEKKNLNRLFVHHWMELKPIWRQYSKMFVLAPIHSIICGRAGDIWEDVETEENVFEMKKVGTKMRVEKELGYEPSLLIEMIKAREKHGEGKSWVHRAFVEKDRFGVMDSKFFDEPTFESFLPHIELLNLGGEHIPLEEGMSSASIIADKNNGYERQQRKKIALEKIQAEMYIKHPGQSVDDKKGRAELLNDIFETRSWTEVEGKPMELLEELAKSLKILNSPEMQKQEQDLKDQKVNLKERLEKKIEEKKEPKPKTAKKKAEVKK